MVASALVMSGLMDDSCVSNWKRISLIPSSANGREQRQSVWDTHLRTSINSGRSNALSWSIETLLRSRGCDPAKQSTTKRRLHTLNQSRVCTCIGYSFMFQLETILSQQILQLLSLYPLTRKYVDDVQCSANSLMIYIYSI